MTNISDYENYLRENRFENIIVDNITWNVVPSVLLYTLGTLSRSLNKKMLNSKANKNKEDNKPGILHSFIVGALGIINYYGTSATKKIE